MQIGEGGVVTDEDEARKEGTGREGRGVKLMFLEGDHGEGRRRGLGFAQEML